MRAFVCVWEREGVQLKWSLFLLFHKRQTRILFTRHVTYSTVIYTVRQQYIHFAHTLAFIWVILFTQNKANNMPTNRHINIYFIGHCVNAARIDGEFRAQWRRTHKHTHTYSHSLHSHLAETNSIGNCIATIWYFASFSLCLKWLLIWYGFWCFDCIWLKMTHKSHSQFNSKKKDSFYLWFRVPLNKSIKPLFFGALNLYSFFGGSSVPLHIFRKGRWVYFQLHEIISNLFFFNVIWYRAIS